MRIAAATAFASLLPFGSSSAARLLEPRHELRGAWGEIFDAVFSADGRFLAFACYDFEVDFSVRLFRLSEDEPIEERRLAHPDWITRIALDRKAEMLAVGDGSGQVILHSLTHGETIGTFTPAGESVHDMAFSPDGTMLAVASGTDRLDLWRLDDGDRLDTPVTGSSESGVVSVAFQPDGALLALGHATGTVRLIESASLLPVGLEVTDHHDQLARLGYAADGSLLAAAGGSSVTVWDASKLTTRLAQNTRLAPIRCVALSSDGAWLAYGYGGGKVVLRELGSERRETSLDAQNGSYVSSVAFSPDATLLAAAGGAGSVMIWRVQD